jgi:hypothetical protein
MASGEGCLCWLCLCRRCRHWLCSCPTRACREGRVRRYERRVRRYEGRVRRYACGSENRGTTKAVFHLKAEKKPLEDLAEVTAPPGCGTAGSPAGCVSKDCALAGCALAGCASAGCVSAGWAITAGWISVVDVAIAIADDSISVTATVAAGCVCAGCASAPGSPEDTVSGDSGDTAASKRLLAAVSLQSSSIGPSNKETQPAGPGCSSVSASNDTEDRTTTWGKNPG